jgi:quercetin dioxygenase-like cupin family protein
VARSGQVIENPVTGERMTFRRTREDTGGAELEVELELTPEAFLPAEHVHRSQEERFTVLDGRLRFRSGGDEQVLRPGDTMVVPAGMPHAWATDGGAGARVRIVFTPAAATELFFAMAREGKVNDRGLANPLRMAQLGHTYDVYLASVPITVQRPAFAALDALSRVLRYPRLPT